MTATFGRVAVLGLGLIGGSLLHAIRQAASTSSGTTSTRRPRGRSAGFPVTATDASAVHGADLVVLAMPLPEVAGALQSLAPHLAPGAVLTDVGTLKAPVLDASARSSRRPIRGRPPAGRYGEHGLGGRRPAAVPGRALVADPRTRHRPGAWLALAEFVCDLGARPVPATADEQDAAVAHVIGLPHVLAEVLALTGLTGGPLGLSLAAGSYTSGLAGRPHPAGPRRHVVRREPRWSTRSTT